MTQQQLQLLWYQALAEPLGLLLATPDPVAAKQALYRARAALDDPDLAQVQIRTCDHDGGQLMLVRQVASPKPEGLDSL